MEMILNKPKQYSSLGLVGVWSLQGTPVGVYSSLPKPHVEVIVSLSGGHYWQADQDAARFHYRAGWVTPVHNGPRFAETEGPLHLLGARLSISAAAAIFGPDANRDGKPPIPLESVIGREAAYLREQLLELPNEHARLAHFEAWIVDRLVDQPAFILPPTDIIADLGWRTDQLAQQLQLSPRGLRKRFNTQLGIGPKFWLQLSRFDSVLQSGIKEESLASLAAGFGYTDQSHMTTEFRRFAARPPTTYLSARDEDASPDAAPHFLPSET